MPACICGACIATGRTRCDQCLLSQGVARAHVAWFFREARQSGDVGEMTVALDLAAHFGHASEREEFSGRCVAAVAGVGK